MFDAINRVNFLDLILLLVAMRIWYVSFQMGLPIELFKFMGIIFTTYLSLHYYTAVSDTFQRWFFPKQMPLEFFDFLVFVIIVFIGYFSFVILRNLLQRYIKLDAAPKISRVGGVILGILRIYFTAGLIVYTLMISSVKYLNDTVRHSYFGSQCITISADTYEWLWDGIIAKFSTKEKLNPTVTEVRNHFTHK